MTTYQILTFKVFHFLFFFFLRISFPLLATSISCLSNLWGLIHFAVTYLSEVIDKMTVKIDNTVKIDRTVNIDYMTERSITL